MNELVETKTQAVSHSVKWSQEQVDLLKTQICKGASDDELKFFMYVCQRRGLDPFARQIWAVRRWDSKEKREVMSIQTSIDGFRLTAERTGKYEGQTTALWCGMDGVWKDVWLSPEPPLAAKVGVWKTGCRTPIESVCHWHSYVQTYKDKQTGAEKTAGMWAKMPEVMIAKCFDEQTEVLTTKGFQNFSKVTGKVLMVTKNGLEVTKSKVWSQKYQGEMCAFESDDLNFCVTPNHTMITDIGKMDASVLYAISKSRSVIKIPRCISNMNSNNKNITNQQIILAAGFLTDGFISSGSSFCIKVSRQRKVDLLKKVEGYKNIILESKKGAIAKTLVREIRTQNDYVKFLYSRELVKWVSKDKENINYEAILSLSKDQAKLFVDSMIEFDGNKNKKTGVRRYYSARLSYIRLFELAAIQAGYAVSNVSSRMSDISTKPLYQVTISERDYIPIRRWTGARTKGQRKHIGVERIQNTTDNVWCVTVPSSVIIVRRNGFSMQCGNCAEASALRKAFPEELSGLYTNDEMAQANVRQGYNAPPKDKPVENVPVILLKEKASSHVDFEWLRQIKKIQELQQTLGLTNEDIKAEIHKEFKVNSAKDLKIDQLVILIQILETTLKARTELQTPAEKPAPVQEPEQSGFENFQ